MELENKKRVAVDTAGNVMAFVYQSSSLELEVEPYDEAFISEPIFTEQSINRFKVVDGVVVRRTEAEIKATPEYVEYQKKRMKADFQNEADPIFFQVQRGEKTQAEYDAKIAEIRARIY
jgi:hypothetical protein